jgi:hypothetical protein
MTQVVRMNGKSTFTLHESEKHATGRNFSSLKKLLEWLTLLSAESLTISFNVRQMGDNALTLAEKRINAIADGLGMTVKFIAPALVEKDGIEYNVGQYTAWLTAN